MTEKEFEKKVKAYLKDMGCWFLKTWSNGVQRAGTPDILACCNGFFLGIELKAEKGKVSDLQWLNIKRIRKANGFAVVLYPHQFKAFTYLVEDLIRCRNGSAYDRQYFFDPVERKDI